MFKLLAKALIRVRECAGWSEPLLVAHTTLLEISCGGSNYVFYGYYLLNVLLNLIFYKISDIYDFIRLLFSALHSMKCPIGLYKITTCTSPRINPGRHVPVLTERLLMGLLFCLN